MALVGTTLAQGQHAAEPELAVHRARHRRRQRLCRARRLRPHHARAARPDEDRGGARRRARPRDHPRHREAHGARDPESQHGSVGRRANEAAVPLAGEAVSKLVGGRLTRSCSRTSSVGTTRWRPTASASRSPTRSGYSPSGLGDVLKAIDARNTNAAQPNGLFASHPETQARLEASRRRSRPEARRRRRRSRRATRKTSPSTPSRSPKSPPSTRVRRD